MSETRNSDENDPIHPTAEIERHADRAVSKVRNATLAWTSLIVLMWIAGWLVLFRWMNDGVEHLAAPRYLGGEASGWYWPAAVYQLAVVAVVGGVVGGLVLDKAFNGWRDRINLTRQRRGTYDGPVCDRSGGPHETPPPARRAPRGSLRQQLLAPRRLALRVAETGMVALGTYSLTAVEGWDGVPAFTICAWLWALSDVALVVVYRANVRLQALDALLDPGPRG